MTIFELMFLALLGAVVLAIAGVIAPLFRIDPWMVALPIIVLGLRRLLGGRWITVAAALALGIWAGVSEPESLFMPAVLGGGAFYVLRVVGAGLHGPPEPSESDRASEDGGEEA
jgi:hypothetical protein